MLKKKIIGLYATSNPYRTGPFKNMSHTINLYPKAVKIYLNKIANKKSMTYMNNKNKNNNMLLDQDQ